RPLALGLRQADREDAVVEAGLDLVLLDAARQGQLVAEPTDGPLTAAQHADPLLLLALAPHRQAPAGDLDVEVVALDAGHLELHAVRVARLLPVVHRRDGGRGQVRPRERRPRVQPAQELTVQAVDLLERVPALELGDAVATRLSHRKCQPVSPPPRLVSDRLDLDPECPALTYLDNMTIRFIPGRSGRRSGRAGVVEGRSREPR